MKIRTDFVTNSSSSSFVCEVCNRVEGGYDADESDFGMITCTVGHTVCESHVGVSYNSDDFKADLLESLEQSLDYYSSKDNTQSDDFTFRQIVRLTDELDFVRNYDYKNSTPKEQHRYDDIFEYHGFNDKLPASACPICTRKYIKDEDVVSYCCEKLEVNKEDLVELTRRYLIEKDKMGDKK